MRAALPLVAALATFAAGCGAASHPTRHAAAPRPTSSCIDRLALDTLLRVPDGPRRPRPLILALHGARQSGYGLQSYTGFTDDALLSLLAGEVAAGMAAEVAAEVGAEILPGARAMAYPPSGPVALPPLNLGV